MDALDIPEPPKHYFGHRITHSVVSESAPDFPFAISTASARNPKYDAENRNCQDAVGLVVLPHMSAGVVCDGAGSTHDDLEKHSVSSNEVGAKLACASVIATLQKEIAPNERFDPEKLVHNLSAALLDSFRTTIKAFCGRDQAASERFIYDFLTTTILGFVVTETQYAVFSCGDGVLAVNGAVNILRDEEGIYLSNALLSSCCPKRFPKSAAPTTINLRASGDAVSLQNIFVASDGMMQVIRHRSQELESFINRKPAPEQCEKGFDFALSEFREIAWDLKGAAELTDDTSFVLLRRVENAHTPPC